MNKRSLFRNCRDWLFGFKLFPNGRLKNNLKLMRVLKAGLGSHNFEFNRNGFSAIFYFYVREPRSVAVKSSAPVAQASVKQVGDSMPLTFDPEVDAIVID